MRKCASEQYFFNERPWCIFTLCEETGTVDCQSDHGNYCYRWPDHGCPTLKHFLAKDRTSFSYFEGKFGYPQTGRNICLTEG